ncbi:class F sortase [Micromonospora sp. NPDC050495]|uniref:class F sortase n=1 Tax=Micromonospora sp. NPDC050495 TaxID=3154936 RepID=UPI0033FE15FC
MSWSDQTATPAGGRHGSPWRAAGTVIVVLLAMLGAGMVGASFRTTPPPRPPQPVAQAGAPASTPATSDAGADQAPVDGVTPAPDLPAPDLPAAGLPRSVPTTISIPRIGVRAPIMSLGLKPDGTLEVPPLTEAMKAGWYSSGASPGEVGNAVVVGHVDSAKLGPAVFFNLGSLVKGDTISVAREDGSTATFVVDEVTSYPKASFPTDLVYGPSDKPGLRVVTCGGVFDSSAGSYLNNVIVLATMAG